MTPLDGAHPGSGNLSGRPSSGISGIDTSLHTSISNSSIPAQEAKQYQASSLEEMLKLHPIENITFTNPDEPDVFISEIHNAFSAKAERSKNWQKSYGHALRTARRTGKPIFIWFHDSKSPSSVQLGNEVLEQKDFDAWAQNNLIRLKYDKNEIFPEDQETLQENNSGHRKQKLFSQKKQYVLKAFEHFNVRGLPSIIILYPDGQRMEQIKGYKKGSKNQLLQKIMHCADVGIKQHEEMKEKLIPQGYRSWKGVSNIELFAKLAKYDQKTNDVWLREFDGTMTKTNIKNLSEADRQFLMQQNF